MGNQLGVVDASYKPGKISKYQKPEEAGKGPLLKVESGQWESGPASTLARASGLQNCKWINFSPL